MEVIRTRRRVFLATGLGFAFALLPTGCGSGSSGGSAAPISPETEKQVQDMLKNKSQDYNERFRKKGGRP
jgi:hypothetical protein